MSTLLFDIETLPLSDSDDLPEAALSPATGQIISISFYDLEQAKGSVYVQSDSSSTEKRKNWTIKYQSEKHLLEEFWEGLAHYDVYVGFGSRRFDVPFVTHRSISHSVAVSNRLQNQRILARQSLPFHVDLQDEFSFYGAMQKPLSLRNLSILYSLEDNQFATYQQAQKWYNTAEYEQLISHAQAKIITTSKLYKIWKENLAPPHFMNTIEL